MTTFVNYDGVVARIVRPDIECTNGFIHLIDKVVVKVIMTFIENKKKYLLPKFNKKMFQRRDITLGGSNSMLPSVIAIFVAWLLSALLK